MANSKSTKAKEDQPDKLATKGDLQVSSVDPSAPRREAIQVPEQHGLTTSAEVSPKAEQWIDEAPRHRDVLEAADVDPGDRVTDWVYKVVVQANPIAPGAPVDPGPDTGPLQAAVNAGYRPTGEGTLTGPELHADGISQVWTWTIPVLKVKGEINPDKPVEKDADVDPTQPGPEVTG